MTAKVPTHAAKGQAPLPFYPPFIDTEPWDEEGRCSRLKPSRQGVSAKLASVLLFKPGLHGCSKARRPHPVSYKPFTLPTTSPDHTTGPADPLKNNKNIK